MKKWGTRKWATVAAAFTLALGTTARPALSGAELENPWASALDVEPGLLVSASPARSDPRGIITFAEPLAGFPQAGADFVIISTGLAAAASWPDLNQGELIGTGWYSDDRSTNLGGLSTNLRQDLVQLTLSLAVPPWAHSFSFDYAFFTEEWPDYFGSSFNDTFVVQVGAGDITVYEDGSVAAPGNLSFAPDGRFISAKAGFGFDPSVPNPDTGTTYDGTSGLLTTTAPVPKGAETLTLTFSLFDVGDYRVDSAVFLDNFRFSRAIVPDPVTSGDEGNNPAPAPESGKITGGGGTGSGHFAGNIFWRESGGRGHWQYTSADNGLTFDITGIEAVAFSQEFGSTATVTGEGSVSGLPGYTFELRLEDHGEPGTGDVVHLIVRDALGNLLLDEGGTLLDGNVQIHPPQH